MAGFEEHPEMVRYKKTDNRINMRLSTILMIMPDAFI
jgi:predicted DNA binding CopG/RHH family protein